VSLRFTIIMRKIETEMVNAVKAGRDWHCANTSVDVTDHGIVVRLHGNKIARLDTEAHVLWVTDAGWQTSTTKSRLNALLQGVTGGRASIYQKAYVWHLVRGLDATEAYTVEMDRNDEYAVSL